MGHNLISRRFAGLAGTLAAALLFCFSALPPAAAAPACIGADVVAEMRAGDVAAYRRLVDEGDGEINGTGKFWRLEKAGLAPSFLFGTMHATDDRATALPPQLRRALAGVDTVIVESLDALDAKRSEQAMAASRGLLVYGDGRGLAQRLGPDRRAALARELAKAGLDLGKTGALKPWMLAMALSVPACETARRAEAQSVDVVVAALARDLGKPLEGLESMAEQFSAFDRIGEDFQIEFLVSAARLFPRLNDVFATMTNLYVEGRIGRLKALSVILAEQTGVSDRANAAFNANLIDSRNERMFSRALPSVEKGGVMIAVGALHLPGEGGLVQRFRGAGFTVTRLY
ncbi:MAG TPA: TraB/GumN family protein [Hyphomicrobiales bacterium]|nr:TraB/GumN family protein [Hyphomicrobiales bacterium]